jgi:hypothetical protein
MGYELLMKITNLLVWIVALIGFVACQRFIPGIVGVWLGTMALLMAFYWSRGIRVSWPRGVLGAAGGLIVGWVLDYGFRHASDAVNDTSILLMAMIFGALNAYFIARWWTQRRNRPLP